MVFIHWKTATKHLGKHWISLEFKEKEGLIGKPTFQKVKPLTTLSKEILQEENILSKERGEQAKEAYLPVPLSHYWANAGHLLFMTMEANVHFMTRPAPTHPPALPDPLFITPHPKLIHWGIFVKFTC